MTPWLRVIATLPEELSSIPSTHVEWLTVAYNYSFRHFNVLLWLWQARACAHTYTNNIKVNILLKMISVCVRVVVVIMPCMCLEVRGQLCRVGDFLLSLHGLHRLSLGHQACLANFCSNFSVAEARRCAHLSFQCIARLLGQYGYDFLTRARLP